MQHRYIDEPRQIQIYMAAFTNDAIAQPKTFAIPKLSLEEESVHNTRLEVVRKTNVPLLDLFVDTL